MSIATDLASASQDIRKYVSDVLFQSGYPDYALALGGFRRVLGLPLESEVVGCTDDTSIYLSQHLTDDELCLVARHEILHVILRHSARRSSRRPRMWNVSGDLELSHYYTAYDDAIMSASPLLRNGLSVSTQVVFFGMTAEEIYDKLMSLAPDAFDSEFAVSVAGSGSADSADSTESTESIDADESAESTDAVESTESTDADESAQLDDFERRVVHIDDIPDNRDQAQLRDQILESVAKSYNSLTLEQRDQLGETELTRAAGCKSTIGASNELPPVVTPPEPAEVALRKSLARYFRPAEQVDKGKTFRRPNKKYMRSKIVMKSRSNHYAEQMTLAVYIDCSGSMTPNTSAKAMGVLKILKKIKRVVLNIHYFSNGVYDEFRDGGGTHYEEIFKHATQNNYKAVAVVTDDDYSSFSSAKYTVESLWLVGVEQPSYRGLAYYAFTPYVNTPNGNITAKQFETFIVGK